MATDTMLDPNVELDEFGKPKKKPVASTLPTQDPNNPNATVALSPGAMSGGANWNTTTGNTDVLAKAQQDVLKQPGTSALQDATTQSAMNWVKNPMGDFDPAKTKQAALEKSNADWANAFESQRQQYGNVSGSGLLQKDMLQNALQHNVDQRSYEGELDTENYNKYVDSLGKSITAGQNVNQGNENVFSQRLGNLADVRNMAEGGETRALTQSENALDRVQARFLQSTDIQGQKDITELQGRIKAGELLNTQSFESTQKALDRAAAEALQKGDIQGNKEILALKAEIDKQSQDAQNKFAESQRIATQSWTTGENVRAEDATKAAQYFDWQQKNLAQTNDLEGQKALATLKNQFDLGMQTQSMAHDEKMMYLESQYEEAKANNDVGRQKDILSFSYTQDIAKMTVENGFDQAKITMQGDIQKALQAGDFEHAEAMQKALFQQQSAEHDKDLAEERIKTELQRRGMDYDMMKQAVDSGAATAEDLNALIKASGINIEPIDPLASQKAVKAKYEDMKFQFALTHPELDDEGAINAAFNDYMNKANGTTSDVSTRVADIVQNPANYIGSADPGSAKHDDYIMLNNSATAFTPGYDKKGDLYQFKSAPAQNTAINYQGNLLVVSGPVQVEKTSWAPNNQYFLATDVNTGQQVKIYANQDPAKPYSGLVNLLNPGAGTVIKTVNAIKSGATKVSNTIKKWLGL